jgi:hypothetical protein
MTTDKHVTVYERAVYSYENKCFELLCDFKTADSRESKGNLLKILRGRVVSNI